MSAYDALFQHAVAYTFVPNATASAQRPNDDTGAYHPLFTALPCMRRDLFSRETVDGVVNVVAGSTTRILFRGRVDITTDDRLTVDGVQYTIDAVAQGELVTRVEVTKRG